ncbi:hypothetical protein L1887_48616 [Cichorium endivia]|nr:hypothetical protein L1887_48616 [Cichorium endivia]
MTLTRDERKIASPRFAPECSDSRYTLVTGCEEARWHWLQQAQCRIPSLGAKLPWVHPLAGVAESLLQLVASASVLCIEPIDRLYYCAVPCVDVGFTARATRSDALDNLSVPPGACRSGGRRSCQAVCDWSTWTKKRRGSDFGLARSRPTLLLSYATPH